MTSGGEALARRWRAGAAYRRLDAAFDGIAATDVDRAAAAAEQLLGDAGWIGELVAPLFGALAADPWMQPPLKVARDAARLGLQLYDGVTGTLTATVLDGAAAHAAAIPATLVCSGRMLVVRYHRAAGWRLDRWGVDPAADRLVERGAIALGDGAVLRLDGRTSAYHLTPPASGDLVTITFAARGAINAREYDRASGALLRLGAASDTDSRTRMLLTLLRVSGRHDAADCFDAATRAAAFDVRWAAMREWLALDARARHPGWLRWLQTTRTLRCAPPRARRCRWWRRSCAPRDRHRRRRRDRRRRTVRHARRERVRSAR